MFMLSKLAFSISKNNRGVPSYFLCYRAGRDGVPAFLQEKYRMTLSFPHCNCISKKLGLMRLTQLSLYPFLFNLSIHVYIITSKVF